MMRTLLRVAFIALAVSAFTCDGKGPNFFLPGATSPHTGNLTGMVASGGTPLNGATVALSGTPARSMVTGSNGMFSFLDLDIGQYTVTTTVPGFVCPTPSVNVQLDLTATANVPCTPAPGTVTGTFHFGSGGLAGRTVTLSQNGAPAKTTTTGTDGKYTFTDVPPGKYVVQAAPPANVACEAGEVTVTSNTVTTANFNCYDVTPQGTLSGVVKLDGVPKQGLVVTGTLNGSTAFTQTTDENGGYSIGLAPGTYSISVTPPAGATCTPAQTVTIQSNQNTAADFNCTSPPGSVSGTVKTDGAPEHSVNVTLTQGSTTIATTVSGLFGDYSFTGVPPGNYTVTITPRSTQICPTTSQNLTVTSGQTATANFDCNAAPTQFVVNLTTTYRHISTGSSQTCVKITTNPPRPGATWSVTWTGPATVGTVTRTGTLDANGEAFDRQGISDYGIFTATVSVTSNGVTVNASSSVTVSAAVGTCPAP